MSEKRWSRSSRALDPVVEKRIADEHQDRLGKLGLDEDSLEAIRMARGLPRKRMRTIDKKFRKMLANLAQQRL